MNKCQLSARLSLLLIAAVLFLEVGHILDLPGQLWPAVRLGHRIMYTDAIMAARKRKLQGGLGAQGTLSITRPKFHSKSNDPWPRGSTPGLGTPAPVSG